MSFSAGWLALREPVDRRARDKRLLAALGRFLAGRESVGVVDLGCGTGSNLRAVAPYLPERQSWRLLDHDAGLLAAAAERLCAWADAADRAGPDLVLRKGGRAIRVRLVEADLAGGIGGALDEGPDLVTAAALFDLVSPAWIGRFAAAVAATGAAFYTALTYDGREEWRPPHPADAAMLAAFHAHQGRDKGFGPAAGPEATALLDKAFCAAGHVVETADSPWRIGRDEPALLRELARGAADAVRETGRLPEAEIAAWLAAREAAAGCLVGHLDCLAIPPIPKTSS